MINNQRFVIPMSNAQSMVNGQAGDLTAHVVLLVNQEPKSEPEFALVHFMVENIALEITNNQRFVIPMSNAQLMVNGQAGDLTAHVVLLVNLEPKSEPEFALVHFMVENIAPEITNNQRFVIPKSNAQLMVNGQVGDLTAHAVLLVNQELNSEPEFVLVLFMVEKIAPEIKNNQGFVIPMLIVQSMVNGEVGHHTARAVLHVNQELNSERELARERNMEVKIALEITNNQECATPTSNAQSMVNGEVGDHTVHAALLVIQEVK